MSATMSSPPNVLQGFTVIEVKGERFLVPDFAVSDVKIHINARDKRKILGAEVNTKTVCPVVEQHSRAGLDWFEQPRQHSEFGAGVKLG